MLTQLDGSVPVIGTLNTASVSTLFMSAQLDGSDPPVDVLEKSIASMVGSDVAYEGGKTPVRNGEPDKTRSSKEGKSRPTRFPFRLLFSKQRATTLLLSL